MRDAVAPGPATGCRGLRAASSGRPLDAGVLRKGLAWASCPLTSRPAAAGNDPLARAGDHRQFPAATMLRACLRRFPCPARAWCVPVPPPSVAARGLLPMGAPLGGGASRTEIAWGDNFVPPAHVGAGGGRYRFQPSPCLARVRGEFPVRREPVPPPPAAACGSLPLGAPSVEGRCGRSSPGGPLVPPAHVMAGGGWVHSWPPAALQPNARWARFPWAGATPPRSPAARRARRHRSPCSARS